MRKVLVVGCGGSGAKTLAYMMDQLRADLGAYGIDKIPGCWQFLNVDTPLQEEQPGSLGSVTQQGGSYVSCGVSAGSYRVVDESLVRRVQERDRAGLRQLATWMPRTPADVPFPVTVGAGQCRGIGRLLILDRLSAVSKAVQNVLATMASPQSVAEAAEVARRVPGVGDAPDNSMPPMVLVISSMAGGSGASMTLDVCRMIAGAQTTPAIDPQLITVFLYTAEVFNDVPSDKKSGMPGNTLAMLGEIIAAQSAVDGAAARLDGDLYSLMGSSVNTSRAFKRVIPIGLKAGGTGAIFGDGTASGVFRGMGRGLARFISSGAFEDFVRYDTANIVSVANREMVSWGVDPTETVWSSFGYASMSTGRDRYGEYAAQRMARRSVDHLLTGFRNPADHSGDTQVLDSLWQARRGEELAAMRLPDMVGQSVMAGGGAVDQAAQNWLAYSSDVAGLAHLQAYANEVAQRVMSQVPQVEGMPVAEWAGQMANWLLNTEAAYLSTLEDYSVNMARERAQETLTSVLAQVRVDLADLGLPYGLRVLGELRQEGGILKRLAGAMSALGAMRPAHAFALSEEYLAPLRAQAKATLNAAGMDHYLSDMTNQLAGSILNWLYCSLARYLTAVLTDMPGSAIKPLEDQLNDRFEVLKRDSRFQEGVAGVADVATDLYSAWPAEPDPQMTPEQAVPERFATAHNEVVLMKVPTYPAAFEQHVINSVPQQMRGGFAQAYREAIREIILGVWQRGASAPPPNDMLVVKDSWVPAGLPGSLEQMASPARYEVRLSRQDLLRRARQFVGRTGEAFDTFISQSLLDYLQDDSVGDFERGQRAEEILAGMKDAMAMARPLVEIDKQVYRNLSGSEPGLGFTFSKIPFAHTRVADELEDYASKEHSFDGPTVADRIEKAMSDAQVSRVDIFGSYPLTLPVAYSGLLGSVAKAWHEAEGSDGARAEFWQFRRARPLPGGLPIGDAERRAMVRGWWLASLAGGIKRPDWSTARPADPISVWDTERNRFHNFPAPMLTSHLQMIAPNAALAAVLESMLLAYLDVDDNLESFRPWRALRHWGDPSPNGPNERHGVKSPAQNVVGELLGTGAYAGLEESPLLAGLATAEERRAKLLEFCDLVLQDLDSHYLPGPGKRDEPGYFTNIADRATVRSTPISIDLAQEMYDELAAIKQVVVTEPPAGGATQQAEVGGGLIY